MSEEGWSEGRRRPQSMEVEHDAAGRPWRLWWTVDARKLEATNREAVSPKFELTLVSKPAQFNITLRPSAVHSGRGGASFRKAKGRGMVEVRCLEQLEEAEDRPLHFRVAVGGRRGTGDEEVRGPVEHRFSELPLCIVPCEEWDFTRHVDAATRTFNVCLEFLDGVTRARASSW